MEIRRKRNMKKYDYLLVGSGLFAGVFAHFANKEGKSCLVLEKRDHVGGNIACEIITIFDVVGKHLQLLPRWMDGSIGNTCLQEEGNAIVPRRILPLGFGQFLETRCAFFGIATSANQNSTA